MDRGGPAQGRRNLRLGTGQAGRCQGGRLALLLRRIGPWSADLAQDLQPPAHAQKEQLTSDLAAYPVDSPVVVGCPSCKIGISRTLLEMGAQREVLHTLEFLAKLRHGESWRKNFHKLLASASSANGVQTVSRTP